MPNIYVRDGVYYADCYYFDPAAGRSKRVQKSTRIKHDGSRQSEKTAERAARDIEASLSDGRGRKARGVSLSQAYKLRIQERALAGGAEASLKIIREKSARVLEHFGTTRDVSTITAEDLLTYAARARATRAAATVEREITELRCAIRAAGVEPPEAPELGEGGVKEVWFSSEDSSRLIAHVAESRRDHAIVYRLTGVRYEELYRLERRDLLSWRTGGATGGGEQRTEVGLRVRGTKTKSDSRGGADRTIPLHPQAAEILQRRAEQHKHGSLFPDRWLASNGGRDLTAAGRRAGLQWNGCLVGGADGELIAFNVLRASFCTELVLAGVPLKKIAYLMGHKTTHMVERVYTRFFGSELGLDMGSVLQPLHRNESATDEVETAHVSDATGQEKKEQDCNSEQPDGTKWAGQGSNLRRTPCKGDQDPKSTLDPEEI